MCHSIIHIKVKPLTHKLYRYLESMACAVGNMSISFVICSHLMQLSQPLERNLVETLQLVKLRCKSVSIYLRKPGFVYIVVCLEVFNLPSVESTMCLLLVVKLKDIRLIGIKLKLTSFTVN